jgi:hypothetical protein
MPAFIRTLKRPVATMVVLAVTLVGALLTGGAATASGSGVAERGAVAKTANGTLTSTIKGSTADGRAVTGSFTPLKFKKADGKQWVKGVVSGVITAPDGSKETFTTLRTLKVTSIDGQGLSGLRSASAAAMSCDILHLVLAPLDLDLLGLQVHLDKVVLDIVAATGAGNLLGNLLCAVTGLLDGGPLAGLLGQLNTLLNQILAALNLGL